MNTPADLMAAIDKLERLLESYPEQGLRVQLQNLTLQMKRQITMRRGG